MSHSSSLLLLAALIAATGCGAAPSTPIEEGRAEPVADAEPKPELRLADEATCALYPKLASEDVVAAREAAAEILGIAEKDSALACPDRIDDVRRAIEVELDGKGLNEAIFAAACALAIALEDESLLPRIIVRDVEMPGEVPLGASEVTRAFPPESALRALEEQLSCENPEVVTHAVVLAMDLDYGLPLETVMPLTVHEFKEVRNWSLVYVAHVVSEDPSACETIRATYHPLLAKLLENRYSTDVFNVSGIIATCRIQSLAPNLLDYLGEKEFTMPKTGVIRALEILDEKRAVPLLVEYLFDERQLFPDEMIGAFVALDNLDQGWIESDFTPEWFRELDRLRGRWTAIFEANDGSEYFREAVKYCYTSSLLFKAAVKNRDYDRTVVKEGNAAFREARQVAREVQKLRKKLGTKKEQWVAKTYFGQEELKWLELMPKCRPPGVGR